MTPEEKQELKLKVMKEVFDAFSSAKASARNGELQSVQYENWSLAAAMKSKCMALDDALGIANRAVDKAFRKK